MVGDLVVDDASPVNTAMLAQGEHELYIQHGGICTRVVFDRLETMSVDEFRRQDGLERFKDSDTEMVRIRNTERGYEALLFRDKALKYHVVNVDDCTLDQMGKYISQQGACQGRVEILNYQYPVICKSTYKNGLSYTIKVPSIARQYRSRYDYEQMEYYPPDVWLTVRMDCSYGLHGMKLCTCLVSAPAISESVLWNWPLANVWGEHHGFDVCTGDTYIQGFDTDEMARQPDRVKLNMVLQAAVDRFFNSAFNHDLVSETAVRRQELNVLYKQTLEELGEPDLLANGALSAGGGYDDEFQCYKVLTVLRRPDGWRRLPYGRRISYKSFIGEVGE